MLTFTNTIETKEQALKAAIHHRDADMLLAGTYEQGEGDDFKGCSVGCAYAPFKHLNLNLHKLSEPVHGIPEWLTRVRDTIFEGLPTPERNQWHVDFVEAIPVGVDLDKVKAPFLIMVLESALTTFDHSKFPDVKNAIDGSIALWKRNDIGSVEWKNAAARAAAYAAYAAADDARAAAYAADDAAYAAAYAARAAAYAAAYAARAADDADDAAYAAAYAADKYKHFAKELLGMIRKLKDGKDE